MTDTVSLREIQDSDLEKFFEHYTDAEAGYMAAFTAEDRHDRASFDAHWARLRANPEVTARTVLLDGEVVGHVASFVMFGDLEVTYWLDRACWGCGVATRALAALLVEVKERPIRARAAKDNLASLKVLERNGFVVVGHDRGWAAAREQDTDELILELGREA